MSDQGSTSQPPPNWGSEPIRGLNYDYLDIDKPPATQPQPVMPQIPKKVDEFSVAQAEDFYQRVRGKIVTWAQGAGAGKEVTKYILLVPDIMALLVRLMTDPQVSPQLKAEVAAASAYIIIPVDLMPEAVLGPAGLIDDAIVGVLALNRVLKVMGGAGADKLRAYWDGDDDVLQVMENLLGKADQFVTGTVWTGIKKFMASAAETVKDAAQSASDTVSKAAAPKPKGPVVEGSYRSILPPGVSVDPPPQPPTPAPGTPDDKSKLPPNERG